MNKQLQEKIGKLIGKDYFKLEFGCEIILHCDENIGFPIRKIYDTFQYHMWVTQYGIITLEEIKEILGTEPTLQDVLLAMKDSGVIRLYSEGLGFEKKNHITFIYDLTKSLFNQTDKVKQQLLELLVVRK